MTKEEVYTLIEAHYRANSERIVKTLSHMLGNFSQAQDVVQETYTRSCQYWYTYKVDEFFSAWISRILSNCVKDMVAVERHHGMNLSLDEAEEVVVTINGLNKKRIEQVTDLINSQKDSVKRILKLFFFDQLTVREIAQLVPENPPNIRQIVHRFRSIIKKDIVYG